MRKFKLSLAVGALMMGFTNAQEMLFMGTPDQFQIKVAKTGVTDKCASATNFKTVACASASKFELTSEGKLASGSNCVDLDSDKTTLKMIACATATQKWELMNEKSPNNALSWLRIKVPAK